MREVLLERRPLLVVEHPPDVALGVPAAEEQLVALELLLDLHLVVREELRRRVDRREAAADDDGREAHLQVRDARVLVGAR